MANDHLNEIERKLVDNLRNGTYSTINGVDSGSAWSNGDVTVFGQFPEPEDIKYPCIILEMAANGIESQFVGQKVTSGSSGAIGELYGLAFNIYLAVDRLSALTVTWTNDSVDTDGSTITGTMDDTALLSVGATISGTGIETGATIASITNSTTFTMSAPATGTAETDTTATFSSAAKQRRLLNYLMLNVADVIMDCDFSNTQVEVTQRHYTGFRDVFYDSELEVWSAATGMVVVFLNTR